MFTEEEEKQKLYSYDHHWCRLEYMAIFQQLFVCVQTNLVAYLNNNPVKLSTYNGYAWKEFHTKIMMMMVLSCTKYVTTRPKLSVRCYVNVMIYETYVNRAYVNVMLIKIRACVTFRWSQVFVVVYHKLIDRIYLLNQNLT